MLRYCLPTLVFEVIDFSLNYECVCVVCIHSDTMVTYTTVTQAVKRSSLKQNSNSFKNN